MRKRVTHRIVLLIAFMFVFGAAIMGFLSHRSWTRVRVMAEHHLEELRHNAQAILKLQSQSLETFTYDYTYWDEMISFVHRPDTQWAKINLENAITTFKVDAVWVFNQDLKLIYVYTAIPDPQIPGLPTRWMKRPFLNKGLFHHLYDRTEQGLWEFRIAPIQPSSDLRRTSPPQGYFVAAKFWSPENLDQLGKFTQSSVQLVNLPPQEPPISLEKGTFTISLPLLGAESDTLALLQFTRKDDVLSQYLSTMRRDQRLILVTGLFLIGLIAILLNRWISQPLRLLSRSISQRSFKEVLPLTHSTTEFGELANLWIDYLRQQEELATSHRRYQSFISLTSDGICRWDIDPPLPPHLSPEEQVLYIYRHSFLAECNDTFAQAWGLKSAQEAIGKPLTHFINLDNPRMAQLLYQFVTSGYRVTGMETEKISPMTGKTHFALLSLSGHIDERGLHQIWGIHHDITALQETRSRLQQLNRLYSFLSELNRLALSVKSLSELYQRVVELAITKGGYRMAWVGVPQFQQNTIKPVAWAGEVDNYLDEITVSLTPDLPSGRGPTGLAYRSGEIAWTEDIGTDPKMEPWREAALSRGYLSSVAIPLKANHTVLGVLNLYSSQPLFFTEEERKLLTDIQNSITMILSYLEEERVRREAEEALRQSRERLGLIMESAPFAILLCDSDMIVTYCNPRFEELTGLSSDQVLNRKCSSLLSEIIPPDQLEFLGFETPLERVYKTLQSITNEELVILHPQEGRRHILFNISPLLDPRGKLVGAVLSLTDITRQKQLEERARSGEAFLRSTLEYMPVAVFFVDNKGNVIYANPAAFNLWGDVKFVGPEEYHLYRARFPDSGKEVQPHEWAAAIALSQGEPVLNQELEIENFLGQKRVILNSAIPVTDPLQGVTGAVVINYDITDLKLTHQMLTESERRYRQLVEHAPFVIYSINGEGKLLQLNPAFEQVLGWKREDWLGKEFTPLVHPEDLRVAQEMIQRVFRGEIPPPYHLRITASDGTYRIGQFISIPIWEGGRVVAKFGMAQDVTELMNLYYEREASQKFMDKLLNTLSFGIAILDSKLRVRYINQSGANIMEAPHIQSLIGINGLSVVHPDYRELAITRTKNVLTTGESAPPVMTRWITFKKNIKEIETTSLPYTLEEGEKGLLVIFSDKTPLQRALDEAQAAEATLRSVIEESNDAIYLLYQGRFELVNRRFCQWLEVTPEEVRAPDFNFMELVAPESRPLIEERAQKIARGEEVPHRYQFIGLSRSGKRYRFEASVTRVPYRRDTATLGILRDLSERETLERQIAQVNRSEAIMQTFAYIAHDFNNLLQVIRSSLDIIEMRIKDKSLFQEEIKGLNKALDESSNLVKQMLTIGRSQVLNLTVIDINRLIYNSLPILKRILPATAHLKLNLTEDLPPVRIDQNQVESALINLVTNARDAIAPSGKVVITTGRRVVDHTYVSTHPQAKLGDFVYVAVTDDGCGMSPEVLQRALEPFFTTKKEGKGTGLGLPSVQGIISQLGGFMTIYSEEGKGTTVKLFFPIPEESLPSSSLTPPPSEAEPRTLPPPEQFTIMVVDDEPNILATAVRILRLQGYRVLAAANSQEALTIIQTHPEPIHLIITDVVMPGLTGPELASELARIRPEIAVAFSTGYSPPSASGEPTIPQGADVITKPYRAQELVDFVKKILTKKSR